MGDGPLLDALDVRFRLSLVLDFNFITFLIKGVCPVKGWGVGTKNKKAKKPKKKNVSVVKLFINYERLENR